MMRLQGFTPANGVRETKFSDHETTEMHPLHTRATEFAARRLRCGPRCPRSAGSARRPHRVGISLVGATLLLLAAIPPALGQALYYRTDLGALGMTARGLNNHGQVVGDDGSHTLLYDGDRVITDLGTFGRLWTRPVTINDSGQIVGWSDTTVFRYSGGVVSDLGGATTFPTAINNNGDVVGYYPGNYGPAAVLFSGGGWTNILHPLFSYNSYAYGINSGGQI